MKNKIRNYLCFSLCVALSFPLVAEMIDKTAISPFWDYCDGYGMPGATGVGYVSVLKVSTGAVLKTDDVLLDGIVAYDRAEANDAYLGQINMETASSFNGLAGTVWGYDIARHEDIDKQKPLFNGTQYDGSDLPVYDAGPLLNSGQRLFGTEKKRRFPLIPGAHVICANKSSKAYRPIEGAPKPDKNEGYGVWSFIAIAIARDRTQTASLFIEDAGVWTENDNPGDLAAFLDGHRRAVVWSIQACGQDQSALYDRVYIGMSYRIMRPGEIGTALTAAPYVVLAKKAVPNQQFNSLYLLSLMSWEKEMGFPVNKSYPFQ